ncbi:Maf-like protein [Holospora obtusa F1]|uniref:Maf-like protein n=1 Tax=Holospora obtusa F1 TaxID=1399147 RepID=W6TFA7_HOLOB|nr:Maf family protein [Holospora obtusa]ETZ07669.1 Maf-like protein [Holospora obtusa F1]
MIWNFATECQKKVGIIRELDLKNILGNVCILEKMTVPFTLSSTALREVTTYLQQRITFQLYEAQKQRPKESFWAVYTVIFKKRSFLEGGSLHSVCADTIRLWSGESHRVLTMMGKSQSGSLTKFRLSITKVKFSHIPNEKISFLADSLVQESLSGGYRSFGMLGHYIRHVAGPTGGCEGLPLLPLMNFLQKHSNTESAVAKEKIN